MSRSSAGEQPRPDPPSVAGFQVTELLGLGAHGAVWAAHEHGSGDPVAIKIGRRVPGARQLAEREAAVLRGLGHPHVVRLRQVLSMPDGALALVLDRAEGGSLAQLLARRGLFTPGEAVTLLVALATALGDLHVRGVVHGDLAPGNVLFAADGRPMLSDLGVSGLLEARPGAETLWGTAGFRDPAGASPGDETGRRAADVWGLGAVAWFALTGDPPGPRSPQPEGVGFPAPMGSRSLPSELDALVRQCLSASPARRPSPAEVAERAWAACAAAPIRLTGGALRAAPVLVPREVFDEPTLRRAVEEPAEVTRRWWRPAVRAGAVRAGAGRRRWVLALGAAVLAGAMVVGAVALAGSPEPPSAGGPVALGAAEQRALAEALTQITGARSSAFQQVSAGPLAGADEPGSAAERMDAAVVERLRGAGLRLDGIGYRVGAVRSAVRTQSTVDLVAQVTTLAHTEVDVGSGERRSVAAVGPEWVRVQLVSRPDAPAGWLVRSVEAAG